MATLILQNPDNFFVSRLLDGLDLSDQEKRVVRLRYGIDTVPRTLEQIHSELGISVKQIGEIESGVLRAMRHLH